MTRLFKRYALVALSLVGSAILLFACDSQSVEDTSDEDAKMMTEYAEHLTLVMSQNGRKSYRFSAPLLEGYSMAKEPYREFRKGVKVTTYIDDSMSTVDAILTANYAIYYEKRELWEAKGNVVVEKSDGKTLYTQQLFWNARSKRIYSNVDSKIVQGGGDDVFIGEGFESDEAFSDWRFRRMTGRMRVEVTPTDSVTSDSTPGPVVGEAESVAAPSEQERVKPTPKPDMPPVKPAISPAASRESRSRPAKGRPGPEPRPVKAQQLEELHLLEGNKTQE